MIPILDREAQPGAAPSSAEAILATVADVLRDVLDAHAPLDVDASTSFARDLELESIEFIALAERLSQRYARPLPFAAWLSRMELKEILALTVGDLVRFVQRALAS